MGQFPVLSVSLKGVFGECYETARGMLVRLINEEAYRVRECIGQEHLSAYQQRQLDRLMEPQMRDEDLMDSLRTLSSILCGYHGKGTIILIDEYDVPLDKAYNAGYYDRMADLIGNLFSQTLKTNSSLYFAVVTGCLRIAKKSIFTGLNNFRVFSLTSPLYEEYFGFTDQEVQEMLGYYGLIEHYATARKWYDGYHLGETDVYRPWDVICYCSDLQAKPGIKPRLYWVNTSGNHIVKRFIKKADRKTQREIERLIAGETICKTVRQGLTYDEVEDSIDNLWSVLFATGYLTMEGETEEGGILLGIPNLEIREIFVTQIQEWFRELVSQDKPQLDAFCRAFRRGDAGAVEEKLNGYLRRTISIRDTSTKSKKENFYHGILLGLLAYDQKWIVSSNAASGDGYCDISIEDEEEDTGIVIEVKYAENGDLDGGCREAMEQIEEKRYSERLRLDGMERILNFGIACYKKQCKVVCREGA